MIVRFGNVLGSSGSVVPIFARQIDQGGPVTVTDPDATRYFMTIPEAAGLVVQAAAIADDGDLLVLDMGSPVPIVELARKMIRLRGLRAADVPLTFIGLRAGERLHERLFFSDEDVRPTAHPQVLHAVVTDQPALADLRVALGRIEDRLAEQDAEGAIDEMRAALAPRAAARP
jgi:FlaA1/EpsC-like NDP-sugar epimerase